ncbi:MAG: hypothetical protein IKB50_03180 [Clostridia bacterium]|nr:hypothetical protein [Clostridia bacterium]
MKTLFSFERKTTIVISIVILCLILSIIVFSFGAAEVKKISKRKTGHRYIIDNTAYYIPLPAKTFLKYRTSDESAVYTTKTDLNDIISLYEHISENGTFNKIDTSDNSTLAFKYNGYDFLVCISENKNQIEFSITIN